MLVSSTFENDEVFDKGVLNSSLEFNNIGISKEDIDQIEESKPLESIPDDYTDDLFWGAYSFNSGASDKGKRKKELENSTVEADESTKENSEFNSFIDLSNMNEFIKTNKSKNYLLKECFFKASMDCSIGRDDESISSLKQSSYFEGYFNNNNSTVLSGRNTILTGDLADQSQFQFEQPLWMNQPTVPLSKLSTHNEDQSGYWDWNEFDKIDSINCMIANFISYSCNQEESKRIQKLIDTTPVIVPKVIYPKYKKNWLNLSQNTFGNYVAQKIIDNMQPEQISEFIHIYLPSKFLHLSCSQHGTRVVQQLISKLPNNVFTLTKFNILLSKSISKLIYNQHATYILVKYFQLIPLEYTSFIWEYIKNNLFLVIKNHYSSYTFQKIMSFVDNENPDKYEIMLSIANMTNRLIHDKIGNYAWQYVIKQGNQKIISIILTHFWKDFMNNYNQQCSPNIFCLLISRWDGPTKKAIAAKLCKMEVVNLLLFNYYGNYILQRLIVLAESGCKEQYLRFVAPLLDSLPKYSFGSVVYYNLIKEFPCILSYK